MRSSEGSWSAPLVGLVSMIVFAQGCAAPTGAPPRTLGDAGGAGDAGPGWPVVIEPPLDGPIRVAEQHARHLDEGSHDLEAATPSARADVTEVPSAPTLDRPECTSASDCESGRCVRGLCTAGRTGDPCDAREHCETFCNLATHRCGDFCVDPLACR